MEKSGLGPLEHAGNDTLRRISSIIHPTWVSQRAEPSKIAREVSIVLGILGPLVVPASLDASEPQRVPPGYRDSRAGCRTPPRPPSPVSENLTVTPALEPVDVVTVGWR